VAPVSGVSSLLDYQIALRAQMGREGYPYPLDQAPFADGIRVTTSVQVPVTSLCLCSKEISDHAVHNQRSRGTITAQLSASPSVDELVRLAEDEASCAVYGLPKRPDEKYVTVRAYDNLKFAEGRVSDPAVRLDLDDRVRAYVVESENLASIHHHSAYAPTENHKN
jgi:GTP cyclohydrolase IB